LTLPYLRQSRVMKVLCQKRRALFPMWDIEIRRYVSAVAGVALTGTAWNRIWAGIQWFSSAIQQGENWDDLRYITAELTLDGCPIPEMRALESLIWLAMTRGGPGGSMAGQFGPNWSGPPAGVQPPDEDDPEDQA